jgi:1,4-dihydroxy-2-naphthoate octaprenyltransferase
MNTFRLFIKLSRPHFLLGGALLYALGVGIAHFLGTPVDWGLYILGQAWGTMLQLSTHYLNEYFDFSGDQANLNRTPFTGGSGALGPGKLPRATAFWAAVACLTVVASLTVLIFQQAHPNFYTIGAMGLIFLGAFFYAVPPIRLEASGYGELTTAILIANIVPAFAMLLQRGGIHRLLSMTTFPLTFLLLAMLLVFELPDYATDIKFQKRTLLVRLGWRAGMNLHNWLILGAYLTLGLAVSLGLPRHIALSAFLTLPLGILDIWYMNRIASGGKPHWTAFTMAALALFGVTAYLITFALWIS